MAVDGAEDTSALQDQRRRHRSGSGSPLLGSAAPRLLPGNTVTKPRGDWHTRGPGWVWPPFLGHELLPHAAASIPVGTDHPAIRRYGPQDRRSVADGDRLATLFRIRPCTRGLGRVAPGQALGVRRERGVGEHRPVCRAGAREARPLQIRRVEFGIGQRGAVEGGVDEHRIGEHRISQGPAERGIGQDGLRKVGRVQLGPDEE